MFEQHFELTKRPFNGLAEGADVFVGPQTASLLGKVAKAFAAPDGVVCVSGPIGSGKTTLVGRSLRALGYPHTVIRIGRIRLGPDEVLDFILRELGLRQMPAGTIQKITVFRNILRKLEDSDVRLIVVVEDAERLGTVALKELEALTATEFGVSDGANLVLMSETPLHPSIDVPGLKRLEQRSRLYFTLAPMSPAEVRGYLAHGLRQAGSDVSRLLTDDAVSTVHKLSEGIPRVIDKLVSSALDLAASKGIQRLTATELEEIATEEFDINVDMLSTNVTPDVSTEEQEEPQAAAAEQSTTDTSDAETAAEAMTPAPGPEATDPIADTSEPEPANDAVAAMAEQEPAETVALDSDEYPIPDLIQDTQPDLDVLSADTDFPLADAAEEAPDVEPVRPGYPEDPDILFGADSESAPVDSTTGAAPASTALAESDAATDVSVLADPVEEAQIPDLPIEDLIRDLEQSAANTAGADDESSKEPPAEQLKEPDVDDIPTLYGHDVDMESPAPVDEEVPAGPEAITSPSPEVPAWERDPTLAQLRPDLDALEQAMAAAQAPNTSEPEEPAPAVAEEEPEVVPEITLDDSIRRKIDTADAALQATQALEDEDFGAVTDINFDLDPVAGDTSAGETSKPPEPAGELGPNPAKADLELERIEAEFASAKDIQDVDDVLAETLFGEEFNMAAAEVAANAPFAESDPQSETEPFAASATKVAGDSANDSIAEQSPTEPSATETDSYIQPAAQDQSGTESDLERQFMDLYGEPAVEVSMETTPTGLNISATQRITTVHAINSTSPAAADAGGQARKSKPVSRPDSIEDQINTSLTQSLMALDPAEIERMQEPESEEEQEQPKTGFFSRFRRS